MFIQCPSSSLGSHPKLESFTFQSLENTMKGPVSFDEHEQEKKSNLERTTKHCLFDKFCGDDVSTSSHGSCCRQKAFHHQSNTCALGKKPSVALGPI